MSKAISEHLARTRAIDSWVQRLSDGNEKLASEVAVDLADLLRAAETVREELDQLLAADLDDPQAADAALQNAANITVQLFTELKQHLESLEQHWAQIEDALDRRAEAAS